MAVRGDLPSGIVTFAFTDIQGSTRLLRRLGDRYSDLLDRHLELMAGAWDAHGGHVIDTAGDGVFVAFQDADAAVNACADAQRRLCTEPWPPDGEIRVRDFDAPIRLFQLAGQGLSTDFPSVRATPADGHNLVSPPTSFHGREEEVDLVIARLGSERLVTLAGPGGVGKTRMSTEIGLRVADAWPDGAWLVDPRAGGRAPGGHLP